jgi:hypothetical protein
LRNAWGNIQYVQEKEGRKIHKAQLKEQGKTPEDCAARRDEDGQPWHDPGDGGIF